MNYSLNEFILDSWTEESAYLLGYLFADGCVYRGMEGVRYELIVSASRPGTLEGIRDILGSDHPIRQKEGSEARQLRIGSKHIVERLEELGLEENKTITLTYPPVPREVERHFIRGYFDGKGSFMIENNRRIVSNFSGASYVFMESLRDRLVLHGLTAANIHRYGPDKSTTVLRYYVRDTRRLYHLMYSDAGVYSGEQKARYDRGYRS